MLEDNTAAVEAMLEAVPGSTCFAVPVTGPFDLAPLMRADCALFDMVTPDLSVAYGFCAGG